MALDLKAAQEIMRAEYEREMAVEIERSRRSIALFQEWWNDHTIATRGYYRPQQSECMPAFMHQSNVWYWLPEDYEHVCECDCD